MRDLNTLYSLLHEFGVKNGSSLTVMRHAPYNVLKNGNSIKGNNKEKIKALCEDVGLDFRAEMLNNPEKYIENVDEFNPQKVGRGKSKQVDDDEDDDEDDADSDSDGHHMSD